MSETLPTTAPLLTDRGGVTDTVRVQILATEHWSLLATRSMTWNEVFSRASMYITVLSAAVVALALAAQATGFGPGFRLFALLVLPVVLLIGLATVLRLSDANAQDLGLVIGMNRLRHAYLEFAPELEPYFMTSQYDDWAGITQSFGFNHAFRLGHFIAGTPNLVAAINVMVFGVFVAIAAQTLGASDGLRILLGIVAAFLAACAHGLYAYRSIAQASRSHHPRFPR